MEHTASQPATVLEPSAAARLTAVLAPGREGGYSDLAWLVEPLLDSAVRVACVTYSRRERSILQDIEDVAAVAEAVAGNGQPAVLVGYSRGGCAVLNAAGRGVPARGVVALSAASDQARLMYGYRIHAPGSRRLVALEARGAEPEEDPLLYRDASPIFKSDSIHQPVLFVHGENDLIIPVDQSWWMRDALLAAGNTDVTHIGIPEAGHYYEHAFGEPLTSVAAAAVVSWLAARF